MVKTVRKKVGRQNYNLIGPAWPKFIKGLEDKGKLDLLVWFLKIWWGEDYVPAPPQRRQNARKGT